MTDIPEYNMINLNYIYHYPGIILVRGMIGSGKTSTAFRILEKIHKLNPVRPCYIYVMEEAKTQMLSLLLPDWVKFTNELSMKSLPEGSVLLADEAWYYMSSKVKKKSEEVQEILNNMALIRQRDQTFILIIQNLAMLDIDSFRVGYSLVSKYTPSNTIKFERDVLQDFLMAIQKGIEFRLKQDYSLKYQEVGHVHTPFSELIDEKYSKMEDYNFGYHKFKLPEFWSEELSVFWGKNT